MTSLLDNPLDFGALGNGAVRFPTNASNAIAADPTNGENRESEDMRGNLKDLQKIQVFKAVFGPAAFLPLNSVSSVSNQR